MYKVKLNFLSLTWVWPELNYQLRTNPRVNVQSQTQFLSLTWAWLKHNLQLETNAGTHVQSQTQFLSLTWVWLKLNLQLKTKPRTHVQSKIQFVEFDLSLTKNLCSTTKQKTYRSTCTKSNSVFGFDLNLTKIQFATRNQCRKACTKSNSIFWVWLEFD